MTGAGQNRLAGAVRVLVVAASSQRSNKSESAAPAKQRVSTTAGAKTAAQVELFVDTRRIATVRRRVGILELRSNTAPVLIKRDERGQFNLRFWPAPGSNARARNLRGIRVPDVKTDGVMR